MSKTFKSSITEGKRLEVDTGTDELVVRTKFVGEYTASVDSIAIANADAPALALAILEAAGVEAFGAGYLNKAVDCLQLHAREHERATAEAKERAELEAEALELLNAWLNMQEYEIYSSWAEVEEFRAKMWLAVARRAREIAKETP